MPTEDNKYYVVFQDGSNVLLDSFDDTKIYPNAFFYIQEESSEGSYSSYNNKLIYYKYNIIDNNKDKTNTILGVTTLIRLKGRYNPASNPTQYYNELIAEVMDSNNSLKTIRIENKHNLPLKNLKFLFQLIEEINTSGGFEAYKIYNIIPDLKFNTGYHDIDVILKNGLKNI